MAEEAKKMIGSNPKMEEIKEIKEEVKENLVINNNSASSETQEEPKKRGRKKIEEMTQEEKQKYEEEKRIKAEKKAEEKRLAELGVNVDLSGNSNPYVSIELSKEFITKCKKEKINSDDYENVIFALMKKFADGEIELKKRVKTEFY